MKFSVTMLTTTEPVSWFTICVPPPYPKSSGYRHSLTVRVYLSGTLIRRIPWDTHHCFDWRPSTPDLTTAMLCRELMIEVEGEWLPTMLQLDATMPDGRIFRHNAYQDGSYQPTLKTEPMLRPPPYEKERLAVRQAVRAATATLKGTRP